MSEDYKIGYGKPPKGTQFKPGQSGNTKGRPKGSKNTLTIADEILNQKIVVQEGGKQRKVSKREAIIMQIANKAIKGDIRALAQTLLLSMNVDKGKEDVSRLKEFTSKDDDDIINTYLKQEIENAEHRNQGEKTTTQCNIEK